MRTRLLLTALLLLSSIPAAAVAQTATLRGTVTDQESGEPLPGASVLLTRLNRGTATGIDGTYSIPDLPLGTYALRVSYIGYLTFDTEVTLTGNVNVQNISLRPDYTGLEEVIVTGIASSTSRARSEVAVGSVDAAEILETSSFTDVSQLLNGRVAGVNVQPSSGNIGGGVRFNIRASTSLSGSGQPVIYIDGVRIDNANVEGFGTGGQAVSMLANLNPEDIESVDILKGPAGAALYGTQGGDGVVLITTKRGQLAGGGAAPLSVTYSGLVGSNQQQDEYTDFNAGTPDEANAFFRDGDVQQHTLSASGGSDLVRFYASYDLRDEEGHIRNNDLNRQSFRANFETFPSEKVTLRANAGYTLNEINRPQGDNNILGYLGNTLLFPFPYAFTDSAAIEGIANTQRINQFLGSVEAEYQPIQGLRLRASVGVDASDLRNDETFPSDLDYRGVGISNGSRSVYQRSNEQYTYDVSAGYAYDITDDISASTTLGAQAFNRIARSFNLTREEFATELVTEVGAGVADIASGEGFLNTRDLGIFAQQEVSFSDRLFLTAAVRQDFASAIGDEASSIFYPKFSGALRLDQFRGLLPAPISFLKVRAAYGESGSLPGLTDGVPFLWSAAQYGQGAGAAINSIGNPEIVPERRREFETGAEIELFNNVGLDLTYYRQWTTDAIILFDFAPSSGLVASSVPFNVGESKGQGIEASLSFTPVRSRNFNLDAQLIWSWQDNEVTELGEVLNVGEAQPIFDGFDINVIEEGLPISTFYTFASEASFNDDGSYAGPVLKNTDEDGDGEIDRMSFGVPYAEHNGSFNLTARLFNDVTITGLMDWQIGNKVFNNTAVFQSDFGTNRARNEAIVNLGLRDAADYDFVDESGNATVPTYDVGTDEYRAAAEVLASTETSFDLPDGTSINLDGNYVEDADFLKLRELSVRYDFTRLLRQAGLSQQVRTLAFTLSGRNLFTATDYSGSDPEVNFNGARSRSRGTDFLTLAPARTIYGTITVSF